MTARQELASWLSPGMVDTKAVPEVDSEAPSTAQMQLPRSDAKPVVAAFLRHCGCPFAEQTFLKLRKLAETNDDVHFVAVSHSDQSATENWVRSVGGAGKIEVIVDQERTIYGVFGLGISSFWHVLNPWSMADVFKLGRKDNVWNRPTESGTRWQTSGVFAVDSAGAVKYSHRATQASDIGDLEKALQAVKSAPKL